MEEEYQNFYVNGDGKYHEERRKEAPWYSNKALFEMIQKLIKEMNDYRIEMRKYNGLKEDNQKQWEEMARLAKLIAENAALPCKRDSSWEKVEKLIDDSQKEKILAESRSNFYQGVLVWGGWLIGLFSFILRLTGHL